mgnify:CR=1 FL=1
MKLVDKIQEARSNKLSDYSKIYTPTAEVIEWIADEYAIEFAEWLSKNDLYDEILLQVSEPKELLEIYKKEKGL